VLLLVVQRPVLLMVVCMTFAAAGTSSFGSNITYSSGLGSAVGNGGYTSISNGGGDGKPTVFGLSLFKGARGGTASGGAGGLRVSL
jgi:hypothetical protein